MNFREALQYMIQQLGHDRPQGSTEELFYRIAESLSGLSGLNFRLNTTFQFEEYTLQPFILELMDNKPIQYILGYEYFGNLKLAVNQHVLIPRPETEELVMWAKQTIQESVSPLKIIDLGTGSGCIPIWLKWHCPQAEIWAMDLSEQALAVAKENARTHQTAIHFFQGDILNPTFDESVKFDLILSNPPYIAESEKENLAAHVLQYEPSMALFVNNGDPLQFYKAILLIASKHLTDQGQLFLELHQDYALRVKALFDEQQFDTSLRKDIYGNDRMLRVARTKNAAWVQ